MDCLVKDFDLKYDIKTLYSVLNNIFLTTFKFDDVLSKATSFLFENESYRKQAKRDIQKDICERNSYTQFLFREDSERAEIDDIIFENQSYEDIDLMCRKFKIIDYGNCYDYSDERYGLINTRQYRAPEVILSIYYLFT